MPRVRRRRQLAHTTLAVAVGLVSLAVGLWILGHPVDGWPYGSAHKSGAPPIFGVGLLIVAVVLTAVGVRRLWDAMSLQVVASRQRRSRRP